MHRRIGQQRTLAVQRYQRPADAPPSPNNRPGFTAFFYMTSKIWGCRDLSLPTTSQTVEYPYLIRAWRRIWRTVVLIENWQRLSTSLG